MTGQDDYYERQDAKRERLQERAEKLRNEAQGHFRRADLREEVSGIPLGQPILVGHHSERRHRKALERADNAMRKAIAADKRASELEARATGLGSGGISSDAPDALELLREKLAKREEQQTLMRDANKVIRKHHKRGVRHIESAGWAAYRDELRQVSPYYADIRIAAKLLEPDFAGRIGFADYQLSNNSAEIRRIKQRIAQLEKHDERETTELRHNSGVTLVENVEANRVQLIFPGKPPAETRALLKQSGFRWSPSEGAWQRHLNNAGIYAARRVLETLTK